MLDEYFKLPSDYTCIDLNASDTRVYAYRNNTRDTYALNGFKWVKVATSTSQYYNSCNFNYSGTHFVPIEITSQLILPAVLIVGAVLHIIFNWFKGIHGHV